MTYLLLDTNIYLHYKYYEDIPWQEVTGCTDEFCILLPMQVLRELEDKKDRGEGVINKRARKVCSRMGDILLEEKDIKIKVISCDNPPSSEFKDGWSVEISDDIILLSAIKFMEGNPGRLIVVSGDNPLLIKAKQAKIDYVRMPEEYRLQANSVEDKEKQRMAEELKRLKSRMSAPVITFEDGSDKIHLKRVAPREPKVDETLPEDVREFLELQEKEKISKERFFILELKLSNNGTAPTGNITVHLDSSKLKTCEVYTETFSKNIPESLLTPKDKKKDWGYCEPYKLFQIDYLEKEEVEEDWEEPEIDNEYEPLTQGQSIFVGDYYIDLYSPESGSIDWVIYDPAVPEPVKGTLHVIVDEE